MQDLKAGGVPERIENKFQRSSGQMSGGPLATAFGTRIPRARFKAMDLTNHVCPWPEWLWSLKAGGLDVGVLDVIRQVWWWATPLQTLEPSIPPPLRLARMSKLVDAILGRSGSNRQRHSNPRQRAWRE